MAEAGLARFIDRWTIEYVRTYPHPIERVWRAITDPDEFRAWFIPGRLDARVGGAYWFGDGFEGMIEAIEAPHFIRFGDGAGNPGSGGYFEYELTQVTGGTRMRFVQHFPPGGVYAETPDDLGGDLPGGPGTPWKPGFVGGWHSFWEDLADYLDDVRAGSRLPATEMSAIIQDWAKTAVLMDYGFSPEQLDRIKQGLRRQERWNELNKAYRRHIKATIPA
ncbi:MAG: SRPBCC domain-containing protein [Caulobacteraceae bacterium]